MTEARLPDYIDHIRQAAADACGFMAGLSREAFLADRRTQQAVILSLIIDEAATTVMDRHAGFVERHPEIPWRSMRNRIAYGNFDINLNLVWETVQTALPALVEGLSALGDGARIDSDTGGCATP